MKKYPLLVLVMLGCSPSIRIIDRYVIPLPNSVPAEHITKMYKLSNLVVLGTPDTTMDDVFMTAKFQLGFRQVWRDIRISVDSVLKGNPSHANYIDYGIGPVYTPPIQPFKMKSKDIIIQESNSWITAPVELYRKSIFFVRKCYNCVNVPARYSRATVLASPNMVILTLPEEDINRVKELIYDESK